MGADPERRDKLIELLPQDGVYGPLVLAFSVVSSEYYLLLHDQCKFISFKFEVFHHHVTIKYNYIYKYN